MGAQTKRFFATPESTTRWSQELGAAAPPEGTLGENFELVGPPKKWFVLETFFTCQEPSSRLLNPANRVGSRPNCMGYLT